MAVPDYQTLMLPVLQVAVEGETSVRACIDRLAETFQLSENDRSEMLPSGRQTTFANRVHWAKTYLKHAEILEMTRRAHFRATERGRRLLATNPERIDNATLQQFEEFRRFRTRAIAGREDGTDVFPVETTFNDAESIGKTIDTATPEEQIATAYDLITSELRGDLLDRILAASPAFFEQLIVDLMIAMGYGGASPDAGRRLGRSGDGGIDGLINEDVLGLDSIYLQAKRYVSERTIGVDRVREFAGALVEHGASKGVFVTTSSFASGARKYAERIPQTLILVDGQMLTKLLVRHGVGVRVTRTIELKRLDTDYFDGEGSG